MSDVPLKLRTCDGCSWWSQNIKGRSWSDYARVALCTHTPETSCYTNAKFGCDHWEDKNERRLPRH